MKNGTEVITSFSSNVIGYSNDEANFSRKILLTGTQVLRLRKAFSSG